MAKIEIPRGFTPRPYQQEFINALEGIGQPKKQFAYLLFSRRSGKDYSSLAYLIYKAATIQGLYFYILPTRKQAGDVIWRGSTNPEFDEDGILTAQGKRMLDMIPEEFIKSKKEQEKIIELINGSIITLTSGEDYDAMRGTNPNGIVISEAAYQPEGLMQVISPILNANKGWLIVNSTPNGKNWFYRLFESASKSNRWYVGHVQTLYPERPGFYKLMDMELIEEERELYGDEYVEREYGCSFDATVKGSIYGDCIERARSTGRIGLFVPEPSTATYAYFDLGVRDDTAIWFTQPSGDSVKVVDYFEGSGESIASYIRVLAERGYNYNTIHLPWDANNRSINSTYTAYDIVRQELQNYRINARVNVVPRTKVQDGINAVRALFPKLHFNETTCASGLEKLALYKRKWDEKRQTFLKEPEHDFASHAADAMRLLAAAEMLQYGPMNTLNRNKKFKVISTWDPFDLT